MPLPPRPGAARVVFDDAFGGTTSLAPTPPPAGSPQTRASTAGRGGWVLLCLAFGERHPTGHPSVYQIADKRLHRAEQGLEDE
jgi:hypothetical protein